MEQDKDTSQHPDAKQDASQIESHIAQLISELSPILEAIAQRVNDIGDQLEKHDQYFDMIHKAHTDKQISDLRGRHEASVKELLDKLEATHKALGHQETQDDFWPALHSKMREMNVGSDREDEFMGHVRNHLQGMHDSIYGKGVESPAAEAGDTGAGEAPAAEVKIEAAGEPKAVEKAVEKGTEEVKKAAKATKKEKPAVGSKEWFEDSGRKPPKARE